MSTFSKRVPDKSDASTATAKMTPPKGPAAPQSSPKLNPTPTVVVNRSVDVGGGPPRSRPVLPPIAIPPPTPGPPPVSRSPVAPLAPPPKGAGQTVVVAPPPTTQHGLPQPPPSVTAATVRMERPSSVRPAAPDISFRAPQASIADTFDRMLTDDDLDAGLAGLGGDDTGPTHAAAPADLTEVRALFAQLAANHVRQVRDFMIDLRSGEATADWIAICVPALRSLRRAGEKLEFAPLCEALDRLAEAMATAQASDSPTISGDARTPLIERYDDLVNLMPQAFALDLDRSQREGIILQSLLMQVPDVKKVTIDRLYAAGLTTLESMRMASAADLVATAGVAEDVARQIVERFRAYRTQINSVAPDATRAGEREQLAQLAAKLRGEQNAYERACESWAPGAADEKKELRKARAQTLLDVQLLLARLGEVDRLTEIERVPFEKKVERLEAFLEEARITYARPT